MPTKKSKVSAYLPPALYARFERFRAEKGLSQSAAVALILAAYFDLDLDSPEHSLPTRMARLEREVERLSRPRGRKAPVEDLDAMLTQIADSTRDRQIDLFEDLP